MARKALEDQKYELIKAHVLDPDHSPLKPADQLQMNRVMSMARLLDRHPIQSDAVKLHLKKYTDIKRTQAYEDSRIAIRLFNTMHTFDYEFWHKWLIEDIVRNIDISKRRNNVKGDRVVAVEHNNLIKALGEKPLKEIDPRLIEQHTFILTININGVPTNIDLMKFLALPEDLRKKVSDALIPDINIQEAEVIMES
jgi:hypothetical protein